MLEYVKENKDRIDYVIIHKVDRLARNRDDDVDISRALREANVQLVSASESIDNTPAGMLMHGIMSSLAEFYSLNLANEVKKGMEQKVKSGGSIGKAPLGYKNVRTVDDRGREDRTVVLDEERAPLVRLAFEEYATGKWTICTLAKHLALRGLTTRATPKIPSSPIDRGALNKILTNPYYRGIVTYRGIEYAGRHTPLVDEETWIKVHDILCSHYNGERARKHPHFLKGSLYCRNCGSRMIITYSKNHSGIIYPYFVCSGRHSKRKKACTQKAILIEEVEDCVERIYDSYSLDLKIRALLEATVLEDIEKSKKEFEAEQTSLKREKEKLEHKQRKLLEAHCSDAIPLNLMKSEQAQISKSLALIESQIKAHSTQQETIVENLKKAFDLIEDCGRTYKLADGHIKRLLNQALMDKIWIEPDGRVTAELSEPFKSVIQPIQADIQQFNTAKAKGLTRLEDLLEKIQNRVSNLFGRGLNKGLILETRGLEPMTSRV